MTFIISVVVMPTGPATERSSQKRAQLLKADGWKLSGELSIRNVPYSYTVWAALGTICCSRHTLDLMPHNLCVPVPHLGTQEPLSRLTLREDPANHIRPSAQVSMPLSKCKHIQSTKLPSIFPALNTFLVPLFLSLPHFLQPYIPEKTHSSPACFR